MKEHLNIPLLQNDPAAQGGQSVNPQPAPNAQKHSCAFCPERGAGMSERLETASLFDIDGRRKYLSAEERGRFMDAASTFSPKIEALCLLLHFTRCRISEAIALRPHHFDAKRDLAIIPTMRETWKSHGPVFGHLEPHTISVELCRTYTANRREMGRGDGTIHNELGHLSIFLNWAVKRQLMSAAPHIERPRKPAPKEHYLTKAEAARLIEAATVPHIRLSIILLLATAARAKAILQLTWDRVDFEAGMIYLRDPNDKTRRKGRAIVPMNRMARAALEAAKQAAMTDFVVEYAGGNVESIKKGMRTAADRAGLEGVSPHVLRHTAAVWMAEAGRSTWEISQMLGHSDTQTTEKIYARFSPDYLRTTADVLDLPLVHLNQCTLRKSGGGL